MAKDYSKNPHLPKGWTIEQCQFQNQADLVKSFSDPRYATDPEFRELCAYMANRGFIEDEGKSTPQGVVDGRTLNRAMSDPAGARRLDDEAIFREKTQAMFADPRYATSPTYRREVEDWLRANNDVIDQHMPQGALVDRNQPQHRQAFRVTFGEGENSNLFNEIKQAQRDKADAAERERIAEQHRRVDAGESTDVRDLGGKSV